MMRKSFFLSLLCAGLMAAPAYAAAGPYVSGAVGIGLPEDARFNGVGDRLNNSIVVNGAVGYNFKPARVELGVGYQSHAYTDHFSEWGDLSYLTVMANGYYDFDAVSGVSPYVMAGAGVVDVNTGDDWVNESTFAWQVGTGVGIKVSKTATVDFGYRYLRTEGLGSIMDEKVTWAGHNIVAGIRYDF
jgi:opacity protein-like surface antigen